MRTARRALLYLAVAALVATLGAPGAFAQGVTTGALSGLVTDSDGGALPGATVTAIHQPTGIRYSTVSRADGRWRIVNVRVGGPYTVAVQLDGFRTEETSDIFVQLGQATEIDSVLQLGAIEETVDVVGDLDTIFSSSRTGNASTVSLQEIENLPTVGRGFEDFARTNPFMTVAADNDGPGAISVAGRNSRYNNIQIDGAVNNDLFGLADTGTPGGQTETTPISLDAIQELELVVADYDVRQGGFSGGSVNAITRSGSNSWKGSAFYFTRDQDWVGDLADDQGGEFGTFEEEQYGFRLGGPLAQDRIFFFVNGELSEKTTPTGWSIDGSGGLSFADGELVDEAQLFRQTLIDRYGFDPGGLGEDTRDTPSDKFFGRLDFNLVQNHQLTLRHNYVDAANDINFPSSFTFEFPSEAYTITNETNSTVAQLNSVLGSNTFNEARLSFQTIKDRRAGRGGVTFPWIEIEEITEFDDPNIVHDVEFEVGTEPFSTKNALDQDILEITDELTWIHGDHTFVFGTHNELFTFDNLFIQNAFGSYQFDTLEKFLNNAPADQWDFTTVPENQPESQKFDVTQIGLYVGDEWRVKSNFSLTYGLRVDIPYFPDEPSRNEFTEDTYGLRTDSIPDGEQLWQPRLGFNWDIGGTARRQLRGGGGIFAGRAPYVWISNNYARTGIEQQFITVFDGVPFNPDPLNQTVPDGVPVSVGEFNLIDPNFKFPQVMRLNLAYDHELPWWGLIGSAEAIYADSIEEIDYRNVNIQQVGTSPFDGRPIFERVDPDVSGAFLITNTSGGDATNVALKLEKPAGRGLWGYLAYVYGDSDVVNEGTSSRAVSNWQFNEAVNPNAAPESTSDFEVEHRITASLSYRFNSQTEWPTTVSLYYNHQSGRPYSYLLGTSFSFPDAGPHPDLPNTDNFSLNGDTGFSNDLFYVPSGPEDVVIIGGGDYADLDAYIESEECLRENRGGIAPRNCQTGPWSSTLDLRLAQAVPVGYGNLEVTLDMLNLANLFDEDSGLVRYVNFAATTVANLEGATADGRPIYSLRNIETPFEIDNVRSRWRAKLGLRYTF